jgi:hypothetical protein
LRGLRRNAGEKDQREPDTQQHTGELYRTTFTETRNRRTTENCFGFPKGSVLQCFCVSVICFYSGRT